MPGRKSFTSDEVARSPPSSRRGSWKYYGIWRLRTRWRWLLLLYPVAMSLALVYFAEHYVLDVLVGGLVAALVMVGCHLWEARRSGAISTSDL